MENVLRVILFRISSVPAKPVLCLRYGKVSGRNRGRVVHTHQVVSQSNGDSGVADRTTSEPYDDSGLELREVGILHHVIYTHCRASAAN